ncbi:hypothetical protein P5673_020035 [Acropora cervicornis]|uniref:Uncharacterized protein n=1 Tax=Acropora cervicornis TaxID=6130 RepID=A0AAD9V1C1_ACRCE|nr:hypothetical protein P5673_020035 [Acropora cervicornis]
MNFFKSDLIIEHASMRQCCMETKLDETGCGGPNDLGCLFDDSREEEMQNMTVIQTCKTVRSKSKLSCYTCHPRMRAAGDWESQNVLSK